MGMPRSPQEEPASGSTTRRAQSETMIAKTELGRHTVFWSPCARMRVVAELAVVHLWCFSRREMLARVSTQCSSSDGVDGGGWVVVSKVCKRGGEEGGT